MKVKDVIIDINKYGRILECVKKNTLSGGDYDGTSGKHIADCK